MFFFRSDPASRQASAGKIVSRARSSHGWPQVFIFPEGTTTNGKQLIRFKTGAFRAGTSIQPVVIKFEDQRKTTWTKINGGLKGFLKSFLFILSTPVNYLTVEFLPVEDPSSSEKQDWKIYAERVESLISKHLTK